MSSIRVDRNRSRWQIDGIQFGFSTRNILGLLHHRLERGIPRKRRFRESRNRSHKQFSERRVRDPAVSVSSGAGTASKPIAAPNRAEYGSVCPCLSSHPVCCQTERSSINKTTSKMYFMVYPNLTQRRCCPKSERSWTRRLVSGCISSKVSW